MKRRRHFALAAFAFVSCAIAIGCDSLIGANFDRTAASDASAEDGATENADGSDVTNDGSAIDASSKKDSGAQGDGSTASDATTIPAATCGDMSGYDPGSPWPVGGYCPTRANHTTAPALTKPKLHWRYDFAGASSGYEFLAAPVIGGDGTIYAPAFAPREGGAAGAVLFAVKNGAFVFETALTGNSPQTPAIGADGTIYVHTSGALTAIHPNGAIAWTAPLASTFSSSPLILPTGEIVVLDGHALVIVAANGVSQKSFSIGTQVTDADFNYSATISPSGVIFAIAGPPAGQLNGALYGFDNAAAPTLVTPTPLNQEPTAAPMFDAHGKVVISTSAGIALFTTSGTAAGFTSTGLASSQPHGAQNGDTIWFPTDIDGPFTYDTATQALNQLTAQDATYSSFAVVGDGSLVFARRSSDLTPPVRLEGWTTDATTTWIVPLDTINSDLFGLAVGSDGTVYVPFGPTIYAIGD